jgi:hypothetical protein
MRTASDWLQSKTTWLGLTMVAVALYRGYTNAISWDQAIPEIFAGFALIFVRDAVVKSNREAGEKVARSVRER